MAALQPVGGQDTGLPQAKSFMGDRLEVLLFTTLANGDTWTMPTGTGARIRKFAYSSAAATTTKWARAGDVFTFTASGATAGSTLYLWIKGGSSPSA